MNVFRIIINTLTIVGIVLADYMLIDLFYMKRKLRTKKIKSINNTKYIIIIAVLLVIFVAYGLLRNLI